MLKPTYKFVITGNNDNHQFTEVENVTENHVWDNWGEVYDIRFDFYLERDNPAGGHLSMAVNLFLETWVDQHDDELTEYARTQNGGG